MGSGSCCNARGRRAKVMWTLSLLALGLALAACGKSSSSSTAPAATSNAAASSSVSSSPAASGCGTVPSLPIHDSSGVIASLGSTYKTAYNGYSDPIYPSAYAHFKPKQTSGFTIGMVYPVPFNSFLAQLIPQTQKELAAIKGVSHVTVLTTPPTGVNAQIQQVNQMIQQHVSVIVVVPWVAQALIPLAAKAEQAGIPVISILDPMPTKNAITIAPNGTGGGAIVSAAIARLTGGKGTVVAVHGVPATSVDQAEFAGYKAGFAKCPGISFDASLVGQYQVPVAKQQLLTYLSSHPQPVAGAIEIATMGPAIIQAFQQTGRPMPALGLGDPDASDLAYWSAHKSSVKAVAAVLGAPDTARATAYAVVHLLSGHGPKLSEISQPPALVTADNLSQFLVPGAGPSSQANVNGPPGSWLPDSYLGPLFNQ
jgi:ribose transport system substrate-binding protein